MGGRYAWHMTLLTHKKSDAMHVQLVPLVYYVFEPVIICTWLGVIVIFHTHTYIHILHIMYYFSVFVKGLEFLFRNVTPAPCLFLLE